MKFTGAISEISESFFLNNKCQAIFKQCEKFLVCALKQTIKKVTMCAHDRDVVLKRILDPKY